MNKHIQMKDGHKNLEEQKITYNLFRQCVETAGMEDKFPLEKTYTKEEMENFIDESLEVLINQDIIPSSTSYTSGLIAIERRKQLTKQFINYKNK